MLSLVSNIANALWRYTMAHEIEGNSAFYTKTPAWHKLGVVLSNAPTREEAWKLAYPHHLLEHDLTASIPDSDNTTPTHDMTGWKAIIRDDGKEIACVRKSYEIMQPWEHFAFFDPYLDTGDCTLESGGSLRDGTRMWALAKLNQAKADAATDDPITAYLLAYTGFDGTLSYGTRLTPTRVVCANTLAVAMGGKGSHNVHHTIRHTKNMRKRVVAVQEEIAAALKDFYNLTDTYKALAHKKMAAATMINYVKSVFVTPEMEAKLKEENKDVSPQTITKINRVLDLIEGQTGLELVPAIRGTAWQAYNAVSEYLTHEHGRTDDSRLNGQWFGESARINNRALALAVNC